VHDLSTHNRYCDGACYRACRVERFRRSQVKAESFELVIILFVLPIFAINVACAVFDFAWRN
jgi:hypothetical protein